MTQPILLLLAVCGLLIASTLNSEATYDTDDGDSRYLDDHDYSRDTVAQQWSVDEELEYQAWMQNYWEDAA